MIHLLSKKWRLVLSLLLVLSFSHLSARHVMGGRISWEHLGGQQYIMHLKLMKDPSSSSLGNSYSLSYSMGSITVNLDSTESVHFPHSQNLVAEVYHYSSSTQTFNSIPPGGYGFQFENCCYSSTLYENIQGTPKVFLEARMYGDSTGAPPKFSTYQPVQGIPRPEIVHPAYTGGRHHYLLGAPHPATSGFDSVHTQIKEVYISETNSTPFTPGYSVQAPLPDTTESPQNGLYKYDRQTGIASFRVATGGNYDPYFLQGVEHHYWSPAMDTAAPAAVIKSIHLLELEEDTSNTPTPNLVLNGTARDTTRLYPGDTLDLDFTAQTNGGTVESGAISWAFDSSSMPGASPTMNLQSLNSSGNFFAPGQSQAKITWMPTSASLQNGALDIPIYLFAKDSTASGGKTIIREIIVELRPSVQILNPGSGKRSYTSQSCQLPVSASTQSGQVQWSPASAVANDTALQTFFNHTSSGWIYASDPLNPSIRDSFYVELMDTALYALSLGVGDSLQLGGYQPSQGSVDDPQWFLYNFPLNITRSAILAPGTGLYRAATSLEGGQCWVEDSLRLQGVSPPPGSPNNQSTGFTNVGEAATAEKPQQIDSLYGFNFKLDPDLRTSGLYEMSLMGLSGRQGKTADSGKVSLRIYQRHPSTGPQLLLRKDTLISTEFSGTLHFVLAPREQIFPGSADMQLIWQVDSNLRINLLQNHGSFEDSSDFFATYQALGGLDTNQLLNSASQYSLATGMKFDDYFSLEQKSVRERQIYPNPARRMISWQKPIEEDLEAIFLNLAGQELARKRIRAGATKLQLPQLKPGLYLLRLQNQNFRLRIID